GTYGNRPCSTGNEDESADRGATRRRTWRPGVASQGEGVRGRNGQHGERGGRDVERRRVRPRAALRPAPGRRRRQIFRSGGCGGDAAAPERREPHARNGRGP